MPTPTQTDVVTSNAGVGQRLPWFGTSYSVGVERRRTPTATAS